MKKLMLRITIALLAADIAVAAASAVATAKRHETNL